MIKVLVVDDDKLARLGLIHSVNWAKYNMTVAFDASNGMDALKIIEQNNIDLAFLDLEMPGMFGLELLKHIKDVSKKTQCVILTMHEDFKYVQESLRVGVLDYIIKTELGTETIDDIMKSIKKRLDEYDVEFNNNFPINNEENFSYEIRKCIANAIEIIAEEKGVYLTATEVAKRVNMSRSYFSTCFKQIVGQTFNEYFKQVRLEFAKEMILNTDKSISFIAGECGFSDDKYFSTVFKSYTGLRPTDFRK